MVRRVTAFGAMLAALMLVWLQAPAQADVIINGYQWSPIKTHSDCAGTGCLQLNYRTHTDRNATDGMYIESVKISSSGGGALYGGIDGKGLSCWNDRQVVKWSKDASQTDLDPGQSRAWDLEIMMIDSDRIVCGWLFNDLFVGDPPLQQCARIRVMHNDDYFKGEGC